MNVGAVTMAYRDRGTIRGTLACLAPFVKTHFVFINDKPYNGEYEEPDGTEEICNEFPNVEVIKGNWEEHNLRNIGMKLCQQAGCEWTIGFDADEMMTAQDLTKLIAYLGKTDKDAVGFISKVYWRTTDYRFNPDPDHVKVCVTRGTPKYYEKQCVNCEYDILDYKKEPFITHHHLSYCEPKDILSKVLHYNHASEINGREWYDKYYKDWKPGEPVYQPFGTKWEAVYDPLPTELKELLYAKV